MGTPPGNTHTLMDIQTLQFHYFHSNLGLIMSYKLQTIFLKLLYNIRVDLVAMSVAFLHIINIFVQFSCKRGSQHNLGYHFQ